MKIKHRLMAPDGDPAGGGGGSGGAAAAGGAGAAAGAAAAGAGAGAAASAAGSAPAAAAGAGAGAATGSGQGVAGGAGAAAAAGGAAAGAAGAPTAGDGKGGASGGAGAAAGADGKGAGDPSSAGAKWEANWRESYAGQDEKKLNILKRYNSPKDALDALFEARTKLDTTRPTTLPKDATPEQVAEYRKTNGIPEKPEGYLDALPNDLHLEEGDKEILTPYLSVMQELNLTPAQASRLIATRQAEANRQVDERMQADEQLRVRTEDELRQEWGPQYRATVNNINGFLKHHFGEDGAEAILQARTPDGAPLVGSPALLRSLGQLAAMVKGAPSTIVGADGGLLDSKGLEARIAEIEGPTMMGNQQSAYWKGPNAEKIQAEYRHLISARDEMKRRAA